MKKKDKDSSKKCVDEKEKKNQRKDKRKQGKPKSLYPFPQRTNTNRRDMQQDETKPICYNKNDAGMKVDKNRR